jgi:hypothetical protein
VLCSHAKKKDIAAATLPIIVSFLLAFVSLASSFAFFEHRVLFVCFLRASTSVFRHFFAGQRR